MAGRLVGSGVTWFSVVVASAAANFLNTSLLESTHRAIGASTAVFAALGLVSGFAWRAKLMAQDRWPLRLGPIVGGIALLCVYRAPAMPIPISARISPGSSVVFWLAQR